jgi:putative ABC transport system permease protein
VAARTLGAVTIDWRVETYSAAAALLTAIGAAAVPAIQSLRGSASQRLSDGTLRTAGSRVTARLRQVLLIGEFALCLALLMAGAVVLGGLRTMTRQHPGYEASGVFTAQVRLPEGNYSTPAARTVFVARLLEKVRAIPGVEAASTTMNDFTPGFAYQTLFTVENRPKADGQPYSTQFSRISPDYFRTMRIRELRGRTFTDGDTADTPAVAVISRGLADQLFPGEEAVGRILRRNAPNAPPITIIGVVDDVYDVGLGQAPAPTLYLAWAQTSNTGVPVSLVVRTEMDPSSLTPSVREALRQVDPSLPLRKAQPLQTFLANSLAPERFRTTVLGVVVVLGLALAVLGIYGVTYRGVVDRTREFAIRLALGSDQRGVMGLVIREALRDVIIGLTLGAGLGVIFCGLLSRLVANVGEASFATAAVSIVLLLVSALVAAMIPAARVLRVDPATALR